MTDETLARSRIPFLIVCNKVDLPGAKKMDVIEEHLEMELYVAFCLKSLLNFDYFLFVFFFSEQLSPELKLRVLSAWRDIRRLVFL